MKRKIAVIYFWCDQLISWHDCQKTCYQGNIVLNRRYLVLKIWFHKFNSTYHANASTTGINNNHLKNQTIWLYLYKYLSVLRKNIYLIHFFLIQILICRIEWLIQKKILNVWIDPYTWSWPFWIRFEKSLLNTPPPPTFKIF